MSKDKPVSICFIALRAYSLLSGKNYKDVKGRILTSKSLTDHNTFQAPEKIKPVDFTSAKVQNNQLKVELPAYSVLVLNLK